jgi:hypothetical protein
MLRFQRFRPPSPDDRAAWAAEQRWLIEDARLVGEIHVIGEPPRHLPGIKTR